MTDGLQGTYCLAAVSSTLTSLTESNLNSVYYNYDSSYFGSFDGDQIMNVAYATGMRRLTSTINFPSSNTKYLGGTVEVNTSFKFDRVADQVYGSVYRFAYSIEDQSCLPYITCTTSDSNNNKNISIDGATSTTGLVTVTLSKRCCLDMFVHPLTSGSNDTITLNDVVYIGYLNTDQSFTYMAGPSYDYGSYIALTNANNVAKIRHNCLSTSIYIGADTSSNIFYERGLGMLNVGIAPSASSSEIVNRSYGDSPIYSNVFTVDNEPSVVTYPEVSTSSGDTFASTSNTTLTYDGNVGAFNKRCSYTNSYVSYDFEVFVKMPLHTASGPHRLQLAGTNPNLVYSFSAGTNTTFDDELRFDGTSTSGNHSFNCSVRTNSLSNFNFGQSIDATLTITELADLNSQVIIDQSLKIQHLTVPFTMPLVVMVGVGNSVIDDEDIEGMAYSGDVGTEINGYGTYYITFITVGDAVDTIQYPITKYNAENSAVQEGTYNINNIENGYVTWSNHRRVVQVDIDMVNAGHIFNLDYRWDTPGTSGNVIYDGQEYATTLHDGTIDQSDISTVSGIYLYNDDSRSRTATFSVYESIIDSRYHRTTSFIVADKTVTGGRAVIPDSGDWEYCGHVTSYPSSYVYGYALLAQMNFSPFITSTGATADLQVQYCVKVCPEDEFIDISSNVFGALCMYKIVEGVPYYTTTFRRDEYAIISIPSGYSHLNVYAYFVSGNNLICHTDMRNVARSAVDAFRVLKIDYSKISTDTIRGQYMDIGNWRFSSTVDGKLQITNAMSYTSEGALSQVLGTYYLSVPDPEHPVKTITSDV